MPSKHLKVKFGGVPFKIVHTPSWKDVPHDARAMRSVWGETSFAECSIRIDGSAMPEQQRRTLMHEILHGVAEAMQVRELMDAEGTHLEIPIDQLATGLCEALESLGLYLPVAPKKL